MIPLKFEFGSCCERPEVGLRIGRKVFQLSEQRHWTEVEHMKKKKAKKVIKIFNNHLINGVVGIPCPFSSASKKSWLIY